MRPLGVFFLGIAGATVGYFAVREELREFTEQFEADHEVGLADALPEDVAEAVAAALAAVEPELPATRNEAGRAILRPLQSGALDQQSLEDLIEGSLRIRTAEGGITADLQGNEEGGVLQLRTPDGDVTVELKAGDEAGELVIRGEKKMAASVEGGITKVVLGYGAK